MKRTLRSAVVLILLAAPASHLVARPNCNYTQLECRTSCRYQQGWGGACSGSAYSETSYCWRELVQSESGSWWPSCHDGGYDVCCDDLNPL